MYSEHLIAALLGLVAETYPDGASLDYVKGAPQVQVGKIIGPDVGSEPADSYLAWWAEIVGEPVAPGTRAAVHILPDRWTGIGLGGDRGVIESTGEHLGVVAHPEDDRYTGVYRLPTIQYGGLL